MNHGDGNWLGCNTLFGDKGYDDNVNSENNNEKGFEIGKEVCATVVSKTNDVIGNVFVHETKEENAFVSNPK